MTLSIARCRDLADKIKETEAAIHARKMDGQVSTIQTGSETTSFHRNSDKDLQAYLVQLETAYQNGACAVVLGNSDIKPASRAPIRPKF